MKTADDDDVLSSDILAVGITGAFLLIAQSLCTFSHLIWFVILLQELLSICCYLVGYLKIDFQESLIVMVYETR